MDQIFIQLAVILFAAFFVAYIFRALKQPVIVGYILAGIILSPLLIKFGADTESLKIFSQFGIAFLLFIVGIHLNPKVIRDIGAPSLAIGLGQIILTFLATFLITFKFMNFNLISSVYIGIVISFSSTIIVMKLLSDNQQLDSLFGKISTGVLIIQDIVAIVVLMVISSLSGGLKITSFKLGSVFLGFGLIIVLFLVGYFIVPKLTKYVAKSQELLFLFAICWCFVVAGLFNFLGFSIEIGALIAGVILSVSPYSTEISSKVKPLRDFFIILFFIILGLQLQISDIKFVIVNALILSVIALVLKPIILMILMRFFGYTKRTNFLVGISLGQISEFSLIVIALGVAFKHLLPETLNTIILTLIITILLSSYMIIYSGRIYHRVGKFLSIFERKKIKKNFRENLSKKKYDIILFGYNRIGYNILNSLKKTGKKYLVVDFNPDIIKNLNRFNVPALYGDAFDLEFLDELPLDKVKMVIFTVPDVEANDLLIDAIREANKNAIVILRAHSIEDALHLYEHGASYVLTPHFLGGEYVANMIVESGIKSGDYDGERKKHLKMLKEIQEKGQRHPEIEKN
jgi:Kef-type K+ transport system membrane component KefB/Trk K+ transport system NAD-binding subunit